MLQTSDLDVAGHDKWPDFFLYDLRHTFLGYKVAVDENTQWLRYEDDG